MLEVRKEAGEEIPGLEQILRGDCEEGYYRFYRHYHPIVTAKVRRDGITKTLGAYTTAEEVAHDIIVKFVSNGAAPLKRLRIKDDRTMQACFRQAVWNQHSTSIAEKVKHRERWGHSEPDLDEQGMQSFTEEEVVAGYARSRNPRPDELFELKALALSFTELLGTLPSTHARILRMLEVGMNQPEIAVALGVSLSSVGVRVRRARAAAQEMLRTINPQLSDELFSETM